MNVYTYFEPVPALDSKKELTMVDHWKRSWRNRGWNAVVLGREHSSLHPRFKEVLARANNLPTVNPREYEVACFLRWLAVAYVGGGFMTDYDCINYFFRPPASVGPLTSYDPNGKPGMMSGSAEEFERAVGWMADCQWSGRREGDKPHMSDMHCIEIHTSEIVIEPVCIEFMTPGWENASVVHFSSGQVHSVGVDRLEKWNAFKWRPPT